jgi:hypothetical protein
MRSGVITASSEARISARNCFCSGVKSRCMAQRPVPSRTGMRLTPGTMVARIRSTLPDQLELGIAPEQYFEEDAGLEAGQLRAPIQECSPQPNAMCGFG